MEKRLHRLLLHPLLQKANSERRRLLLRARASAVAGNRGDTDSGDSHSDADEQHNEHRRRLIPLSSAEEKAVVLDEEEEEKRGAAVR
jgi:hypothetical protein